MPIYVWHCVDCGAKIERFRHGHHAQPPPRKCDCGGNMNLVINPPNLMFMGGGWQTPQAKEDDNA